MKPTNRGRLAARTARLWLRYDGSGPVRVRVDGVYRPGRGRSSARIQAQ